jgi:hypothetical protein
MIVPTASLTVASYAPTLYKLTILMDLITLDEYKSFTGASSTKEDERLNRLIPSISQLVKSYCNSGIIDNWGSDITEYFDIQWDSYTVQLKYSPIVLVQGVYQRIALIHSLY